MNPKKQIHIAHKTRLILVNIALTTKQNEHNKSAQQNRQTIKSKKRKEQKTSFN